MKRLLTFLLGTTTAFAQFSFGVRGGVPFTDFFQSVSNPGETFNSSGTPFIIGPTVGFALPFGLGVEGDVLYRNFHYSGSATGAVVDTVLHSTASNAWEFPLLAKYRLPGMFVRPFLDGGVAFDRWSGAKQIITSVQTSNSNTSGTNAGMVLGAGIELHLPFVRLSPEIRYTRWSAASVTDLGGALQSNQNQAEFLVGLTF